MVIEFNTNGNDKQKLCCIKWNDKETKEIVYGGSKGCFSAETLVKTINGHKEISKIKEGELVLSFDEYTKDKSYQKVLKKFVYGGGKQSKMIAFEFHNGVKIKCTDNHEFYFKGDWVAAGVLAGRILELRREYKSKVFSFNKRCYSNEKLESFEINEFEIKSISTYLSNEYVYDLCVDNNHNYVVSDNNIIVHNSGKSYLGCQLIFGNALTYPGTRYFIARKKLKDLIVSTTPTIKLVFDHWGLNMDEHLKFNGQYNTFHFKNGSQVVFTDAKYVPSDPTYARFGSLTYTMGWIEEAGEFEYDCSKNLKISVGRWHNEKYGITGKVLETCNPAKNYLYDNFYLPDKDGTIQKERCFIQALPADNKMLDDGYLEELERQLDHNQKQRLLYGNWEYDDNPYALFDYEDILSMYLNDVEETSDEYITADIAYTGADKFVLGYWKGLILKDIESIDKIDQSLVSKKIHEFRTKSVKGQPKRNVPIKNVIYDADGLKMFVIQSSKTGYLAGATQFHNGAKPIKIKNQIENFANLKTQCTFKLAEYVRNGKIKIETVDYRDEIVKEFQQILRNPLKDNERISQESKKNVRERLGRSPDYYDMMNMRMFFEIYKKTYNRDTSWVSSFI